jgi:hypothetical protein
LIFQKFSSKKAENARITRKPLKNQKAVTTPLPAQFFFAPIDNYEENFIIKGKKSEIVFFFYFNLFIFPHFFPF